MQPAILEALPTSTAKPVTAREMWWRIGCTGSRSGVGYFLGELVAAGLAERSMAPWRRGMEIGVYRRRA